MDTTYTAEFHIDLGDAISDVGELVNNINANLSNFGVNEKVKITSNVFNLNVSVDRELTSEEQEKMKTVLSEQFEEVAGYKISLVSFGRKSGNVEQLVVQ